MRPMTACASLSEAVLGRPSLLQAAVCCPSLSEAAVVITSLSEAGTSTEHRRASSRRPAPAPSTGIAPSTSTRRPVSTTRTASTHHRRPVAPHHASSQHRHRRPLSLPCALPAPSTTARTSTRHRRPAPAPCFQHRQPVSKGRAGSSLKNPIASLSTGAQHQQPVSKARTGNSLLFEVRPHSFAIWGIYIDLLIKPTSCHLDCEACLFIFGGSSNESTFGGWPLSLLSKAEYGQTSPH